MHTVLRTWRIFVAAASTAVLVLVVATVGMTAPAGAAGTAATTTAAATLPQVPVAAAAATWLASKLTPGGFITGTSPGTAEYSETVNSLLALAAANVDLPLARTGLAYMEANADAYIAADGSDGPGQLSLLILMAHSLGADPTNFGGTNLLGRLLATEQTSGSNTGRFGTDAQVPDFNSGPYDQGLALTALRAAGMNAPAASISWLQQAQCPNGGWTAPDPTDNPCTGDPAAGEGPDTNTTALALQGLVAQGGLTSSISSSALTFLEDGQNADGGWAYDPNAPDNTQTSDPDSTSLVIQALLALGLSPDGAQFDVGGHVPTAILLSFRVASGPDAGAFFSPFGSPTTGDLFASFQAVPALMGLRFGFGPSGTSYWLSASDGGIFAFGGAPFHGSLGGVALNEPIVGSAPTLGGQGYWLVASDGGVFSFGNAGFFGSMGGKTLNEPVVGMAAAAEGSGYWLVASDGGVFDFGGAGFYGSMGGKPLNKPIVGIASTPDGRGYWLVASDGGIFDFGDAGFFGSMGGKTLNQPIVGIASTPDAAGYWLVASDGGIFAFGDAGFFGSMGGKPLNKPIVGIASTPDGGGYWLVASDGGVFTFGDATYSGSTGGKPLNAPIVSMAPSAT
jgi:hypothetical protein